jgi:DNA invertase Pin-like site-specific DNA recombinase
MSCEFQEQKCREYCEYRGLDVRNVYYDKGISGKRADNRPGLQKAMQEVCQRQGVLVVYDLFRLARSTRDAINILERLERRKADLAIITQQIDTSTPMGRAFFQMAAVFGELERANTAERTRATLVARQAAGFRVGRYPPYGWALDPQFPSRVPEPDGEG